MLASEVCAVIVSYNPEPQLLDNASALLAQVRELVIVDNGSEGQSNELLEKLSLMANTKVIRNGKNLGIAAALNLGIRHAIDLGYTWVATFDQDSSPPGEFIKRLFEAYTCCPYRDSVAVVGPRYREKHIQPEFIRSFVKKHEHELFSSVRVTMTSGNLVKTQIFQKVGFFDEPLFIDYVDYEFCMRVRKGGWHIIEAQKALLEHTCGANTVRRVGRKVVRTSNHSALRRYYISRNRMILFRRYFKQETFWVLDDMRKCIFIEPVRVLLFERDRMAKMRATFKGLRDGILNRVGPAPQRI